LNRRDFLDAGGRRNLTTYLQVRFQRSLSWHRCAERLTRELPSVGNGDRYYKPYTDDGLTWRATARYALTPEMSAYASYARGRRPMQYAPSSPTARPRRSRPGSVTTRTSSAVC